MKSIALLQGTRLLLAATFLSPLLAHSSEEAWSAIGQRATQKLALADTTNAAVPKVDSLSPAMETRWQELQQTVHPEMLIKRSAEFRMDFPKSRYAPANRRIHAGAQKAFRAQQEAKLTSEAIEDPAGNQVYRGELIRAMRGSKESAYRVAKMYEKGTQGLPKDRRRTEQWMRIAAELGMGKASWEVANIYNRDGRMADAAKFETRAVRDGFVIPPRVPNRNIIGF